MRAIAAMLAVGVVVGGVALSAPAHANGRFPESQRLLEHPGNPNRLYMTATYGLLVSEDRGQNWYAICEQAFALAYIEGDPLLEVMPNGSLVSGIYNSLNVSSDCGCGWTATLATGDKETVTDVTLDKNGSLLATVRDLSGPSGARVRIHQSTDGGKTWTVLVMLADNINDVYTIDVAPSDTNRIYLTAVTANPGAAALLMSSKDRGKTWTSSDIPGTSNAVQPFIAAVHPTNADRIFVRTDDWSGTEVDQLDFAAHDSLLQSTDGGKTWSELIRKGAKLFGFALSPDGNTILAGYGDPFQAGGRTSNSDDFGIYKAPLAQPTQFERIFVATISCLRWTAQGLYACTVQNHPDLPTLGMSLGFAPNADFTMATAKPFTSLMDVKKIKGPMACNAAKCGDAWTMPINGNPAVCEQLGATCAADTSKNVLSCAAVGGTGGAGGAGSGTGGAGATGGAGGASGTGGAGGAKGGGTGNTGGGGGGGCGCSVGSGGAGGALAGISLLALLALGAAWRRRRQRVRL